MCLFSKDPARQIPADSDEAKALGMRLYTFIYIYIIHKHWVCDRTHINSVHTYMHVCMHA